MVAAEIICVGSELLLGQIVNSNAQFLSSELAELGIDCYFQITVGDNKERIKACLKQAVLRSDLLLLTGGLGPTADDLTTECVAELFGAQMVLDAKVMAHIEDWFARRGYPMPESNRKQAQRPEGAQLLPNSLGTAPGIIWEIDSKLIRDLGSQKESPSCLIMTLPGVPSEMESMWRTTARPFLEEKYQAAAIFSCELKHYGIGESALAEMYSELLDGSNPTIAPLAGRGECRLRVTAKSDTLENARHLAQGVIDDIKHKSGTLCYGIDKDNLESVVGKLLTKRNLKVAFAESCTGGLASKRLTDIAGSSQYLDLGIVAYGNEAKKKLLGVHQYILDTKGAVSPECAHAMATGIKAVAGADIGVGITGLAGPDGGTADKPVGLVYVALVADHFQRDKCLRFPPSISRAEIRQRTVSEALNMVRLYLLES